MYENETEFPPWILPTHRGADQSFHDIKSDPECVRIFETGKVKVSVACQGCNIPGGGGHSENAHPPEGHWSENQTPCTQSDREKAACPIMRDTVRDVIHFADKCSALHCPTCEKLRAAGRLRINELVTVHAQKVVTVQGQGGQVIHTMQGYCFVGRYLGQDNAGGSMRFELMDPGKGPSGLRGWVTQSGVFMEDISEDVREQLEKGPKEPPKIAGGIQTASSMKEAEAAGGGGAPLGPMDPCWCGSKKQYQNCHGR